MLWQRQPLGQQLGALVSKALLQKLRVRDAVDTEVAEVVPQLAPRSKQGDVDIIGHRDRANGPVRVTAVFVDIGDGHFARVVDRSA